jgi:putative oxidoreductase
MSSDQTTLFTEGASSDVQLIILFACRALVAFYFLWAAASNIGNYKANMEQMRGANVPAAAMLLPVGIALQILSSLLFLHPRSVVVGAFGLCAFVLAADAMFHRFWTYSNAGERLVHKRELMGHIALIGGIVGLAVNTAVSS